MPVLTGTAERSARTALVLAGGGARGAYQAGVLQGLVDIGCLARERCNGDQRQALRLVSEAHPDLVSAYSDGTTL